MQLFIALVVGAAFGAVLDRIGATNPSVLGRMLALRALGLMKAIILAIGVALLLTFAGQMTGIVDVGHMSVKTAYVGVFLGGMLLGFDWALSGYCPGTGLCALASGRRDALFFVAGGLLGAFAYIQSYDAVKATGLLEPILGGKVTIGAVPGSKFGALFPGLPGDIVGIVLGLVFIAVAFVLPEGRAGDRAATVPAE
ncbi:MAG: YeeE/YedE thiosulfate transporter family protein [Paracoccaceae bacterium]|nr:YeeE/YedE thiosulfate transporter family protein [Paracoccaceae bacterium]